MIEKDSLLDQSSSAFIYVEFLLYKYFIQYLIIKKMIHIYQVSDIHYQNIIYYST
jgi:hypothetical protein